jgi:DNA-binding CsgD family transcriptional regulator
VNLFDAVPLIAASGAGSYGLSRRTASSFPGNWSLTPGESRVVHELASGRTTAQIARELGLSVHTIRTHLKRAMVKADVHSQVALVASVHQRRRT